MVKPSIIKYLDNTTGGTPKKLDDVIPNNNNKVKVGDDNIIIEGSSNPPDKELLDSFSTIGEKVKKNALIPTPKNVVDKPKLLMSTDDLAKKLGFKNEDDIYQYIAKSKKAGNWDRLRGLFGVMRENKTIISSLGIGAAATTLYFYCLRHQENNSGCFRYKKDKRGGIRKNTRKKIAGYSCLASGGEKLQPKRHPLYRVEKWDCNFTNFRDDDDNNNVNEILDLGCAGLCNLDNFNKLATLTDNYKSLEESLDNHPYVYKCEKVTILQFLIDGAGNTLDDIVQGVINSDLGTRFRLLFDFDKVKYLILILIIFFFYYHFSLKWKLNNCVEKNIKHINGPPIGSIG